MIKALLIDDEQRATDSLQLMLQKFVPEIKQVWSCNEPQKAPQMIHKLHPDLVFLDIRMPYLNGFELLDLIHNKNFLVIFTTAYDEYAIKAIRFSAFDYLLKPIDAEELIAAVQRFLTDRNTDTNHKELFRNFATNLKQSDNEKFRLALPSVKGVLFIYPSVIVRCEGEGNYTRFFLSDGRQHLTSRTLREYEELLVPYGFIRTHKSHLVNIGFVSYIDHEGFLILTDTSRVEISRRRKKQVLEVLTAR